MTRLLPSRRVSSAWPSALLILCAPVWARSSRLRYRRRSGIRGVSSGRRRGRVPGQSCPLQPDGGGQPVGAVQRCRTAGKAGEQVAQLRPEHRILSERVVRRLELLERGHQRFRHVAATEVPLHPPSTRAVRVEQPGLHGGRPERDVRAIVAGRPRPLDEERDPERVLDRADSGFARSFDAGRHVDGRGRDRHEAHLPRCPEFETTCEDDRYLTGDRGGEALRGAGACPTRMWPAGRVEHDPVDPGSRNARARTRSAAAPARSAGSDAGIWRTFQVRRPTARATSTVSRPASWTTSGSMLVMTAARCSESASAVIATIAGRRSPVPAARAIRARSVASSRDSSRGVPGTTLSPIASAPAATAARTPGRSVTPKILTNGRRATLAGSSGAAPPRRTSAPQQRIRRTGRGPRRRARRRTRERASGRRSRAPGRPFGDDQSIVRHELAEPRGADRRPPRASGDHGCSGR